MSRVTFLTSAVFGQVGLLPVSVRRELPEQPRGFSPMYPGPIPAHHWLGSKHSPRMRFSPAAGFRAHQISEPGLEVVTHS